VITIHQRYRQTDRQTTCDRNTALCTSASRGKNRNSQTADCFHCSGTMPIKYVCYDTSKLCITHYQKLYFSTRHQSVPVPWNINDSYLVRNVQSLFRNDGGLRAVHSARRVWYVHNSYPTTITDERRLQPLQQWCGPTCVQRTRRTYKQRSTPSIVTSHPDRAGRLRS